MCLEIFVTDELCGWRGQCVADSQVKVRQSAGEEKEPLGIKTWRQLEFLRYCHSVHGCGLLSSPSSTAQIYAKICCVCIHAYSYVSMYIYIYEHTYL